MSILIAIRIPWWLRLLGHSLLGIVTIMLTFATIIFVAELLGGVR